MKPNFNLSNSFSFFLVFSWFKSSNMKYPLYLIAILLGLYSCNTEKPKQQWVKGNLHTHTLWSDGDDFPEMVLKWYKDHNYQFIALSDHNTIADKERWYRLKDREYKKQNLRKISAGVW